LYLRFVDIWDAADAIREILSAGRLARGD